MSPYLFNATLAKPPNKVKSYKKYVECHYPDQWRDHLELALSNPLRQVRAYVHWHLHNKHKRSMAYILCGFVSFSRAFRTIRVSFINFLDQFWRTRTLARDPHCVQFMGIQHTGSALRSGGDSKQTNKRAARRLLVILLLRTTPTVCFPTFSGIVMWWLLKTNTRIKSLSKFKSF